MQHRRWLLRPTAAVVNKLLRSPRRATSSSVLLVTCSVVDLVVLPHASSSFQVPWPLSPAPASDGSHGPDNYTIVACRLDLRRCTGGGDRPRGAGRTRDDAPASDRAPFFPWQVASRGGSMPGIRPGESASTRHRRSTQRKRSASSPVGRSTTGNGCCCPPSTQASLADTKSSLLHFCARRARLHCLRAGG